MELVPNRTPMRAARAEQSPVPPVPLLLSALILALSSLWISGAVTQYSLRLAAIVLVTAGLVSVVVTALQRRRSALRAAMAWDLLNDGQCALILCSSQGSILKRADLDSGDALFAGTELGQVLRGVSAQPSELIRKLHGAALSDKTAVEECPSRNGPMQIRVDCVDATPGRQIFAWRFKMMPSSGRGDLSMAGIARMSFNSDGVVIDTDVACRDLIGPGLQNVHDLMPSLPEIGAARRIPATDRHGALVAIRTPRAQGRQELWIYPEDETSSAGAGLFQGDGWQSAEALPVPLMKIGIGGQILASNAEARRLLRTEITVGARLADLLEGLGRPMTDWLAEVARGNTVSNTQFLRGTGQNKELFVQISICRPHGNDRSALIAVLHDVTEFKTLEAQFVQSQKMHAIGQLAGGVAHDFNNLLTAISGHCDLLLLRHDPGDADFSDLIQIHQNTNRAAALVGQLLAYSRKQDLKLEAIDLREALADLTHLLNRLVGERVHLVLQQQETLYPIRADKQQLEQVVVNLVVNARDAMDMHGEVRIETTNVDLETTMTRERATVPPGSYVCIRVIDQGKGIEPEMLPHIFEPFYTTKGVGEGTGLGLSTAYGIVKQSGGFIFAESGLGRGTTFTVYLPALTQLTLAEEPMTDLTETPSIERTHVAPVRDDKGIVLLVEDEAPVRAFACRALTLRGYEVLEADSAEAALNLLGDPDLCVDLFVTDVVMPGMDGPTWVRQALRDRPETKVVFMSGYSEDGIREDRATVPNSVFLPKPFSLNELTQTVAEQLSDVVSTAGYS